jgi:hypothetical protein
MSDQAEDIEACKMNYQTHQPYINAAENYLEP